ncbi:MAG: cbb3-type cytochrome oxidase assembly protein [SAR324 cluster bacterium]|nr:cbb3-type cytochrome oxidase assembly protein [SAR324 cluster bacterium]
MLEFFFNRKGTSMFEVTMIQFMVALFMSLGALCIFIWAVLSGLFTDMEDIKHRAYRAEVNDE